MINGLSRIYQAHQAQSRSISAENPDGRKGFGGMADEKTTLQPAAVKCFAELGRGWKCSPSRPVPAGKTVELMNTDGPGIIRHMWITLDKKFYRDIIIRIYWDEQENPSVAAPLGDLFCCGWNERQNINSIPLNVNPSGGMNIFFPMPFNKHARITVENDSPNDLEHLFYTINYTLEPIEDESLYFHALWRRSNPLEYKSDYVILPAVKGSGHYVGTFMSWQQNNAGWWGEGEIKMFLDDDSQYPTICGTGTEDYFGGAWCFDAGDGAEDYSAPFMGFGQVRGKSGDPGARMAMYRFHVYDPIFFKSRIRATMQAIGWRSEGRYLPLQDDISSVAYWYQTLPTAAFEPLPDRNFREII
jgi:hypothetical protein